MAHSTESEPLSLKNRSAKLSRRFDTVTPYSSCGGLLWSLRAASVNTRSCRLTPSYRKCHLRHAQVRGGIVEFRHRLQRWACSARIDLLERPPLQEKPSWKRVPR